MRVKSRFVPGICLRGVSDHVERSIMDDGVCGWYMNPAEDVLLEVFEVEYSPSWLWESVMFMSRRGVSVMSGFADSPVMDFDGGELRNMDLAVRGWVGGYERGFWDLRVGDCGGWNVWLVLGSGFFRTRRFDPLRAMLLLRVEVGEYLSWLNGSLVGCRRWELREGVLGRVVGSLQDEYDVSFRAVIGEDVMDNRELLGYLGGVVPGFDKYRVVDPSDGHVKGFSFYAEV